MSRSFGILLVALLCWTHIANAQPPASPQPPAPAPPGQQEPAKKAKPPAAPTEGQPPETNPDDTGTTGDRIFGLLPNYTTVEGAKHIQPVSTKDMFHMAAQDAFDPPVFPFVAFTTWLAGVQGEEASWGRGAKAYGKRYATTFSDDAIATFLTTAVMPSLLHQDPRYFQLGKGSAWHRTEYAATRSFVTLGRSGHSQFNFSDVTGNFVAAAASNFYHPVEDRTWPLTMTRWGTQMMWDVLSSELKEFWPDIRHKIRKS
jgi:hypothetical protein